jgi:hypothetical protein
MNIKLSKTVVACLGLSSSLLVAGTSEKSALPQEDTKLTAPKSSLASDLLSFSLDARARYEFREQDGSDASHAGTARFRPGLTLFPKKDLSIFVESEHTFALLDDYQVGTGQSANFSPFNAGNTAISDPESNELNQAYARYRINEFASVTAGRQRYILDKAAFVGNVGWRQNEQTLDALSIKGSFHGFEYTYAIGDQVNRIFGSDASGAVEALEGTFHLLNGSYKLDAATVGGYVYLMDFDQGGWASNNTYGAYSDLKTESGDYHLELAFQTEAGSKADYDALYGAASWSKKFGSVNVTGGVEYLGDGFITPLSTVHAFNGYADAFIGNRLGLVDTWDGITDIYVGASTKVNDVVLKGTVHAFFDDSLSDQYGWEADLVAVTSISENTKILAKAAYFVGEEGTPFHKDIQQFSIQLDYSF